MIDFCFSLRDIIQLYQITKPKGNEMTEQHRAYVFDTETTGKRQPVIVETALLPMLIVEGYPLPATMQAEVHRWNPGKPIEEYAKQLHAMIKAG